MTSLEIQKKIADELEDDLDISNMHGIVLSDALTQPIKQTYFSFNMEEKYELWTVLEETTDGNGYKIFYDEQMDSFGLGIKSHNDELISLGNYGTFLETLESM